VPLVKDIVSIHTNTPLDRFLGQQAQVFDRRQFRINHAIHADILEIAFTENTLPEEHACLYLFPIDDHQYCLQLLYLQHDARKADRSLQRSTADHRGAQRDQTDCPEDEQAAERPNDPEPSSAQEDAADVLDAELVSDPRLERAARERVREAPQRPERDHKPWL